MVTEHPHISVVYNTIIPIKTEIKYIKYKVIFPSCTKCCCIHHYMSLLVISLPNDWGKYGLLAFSQQPIRIMNNYIIGIHDISNLKQFPPWVTSFVTSNTSCIFLELKIKITEFISQSEELTHEWWLVRLYSPGFHKTVMFPM